MSATTPTARQPEPISVTVKKAAWRALGGGLRCVAEQRDARGHLTQWVLRQLPHVSLTCYAARYNHLSMCSGGAAMVVQVLTLMPLRTAMNYQYRCVRVLRRRRKRLRSGVARGGIVEANSARGGSGGWMKWSIRAFSAGGETRGENGASARAAMHCGRCISPHPTGICSSPSACAGMAPPQQWHSRRSWLTAASRVSTGECCMTAVDAWT